ncbi:LPXTG cell wall anchor domain-containing protein [Pasteuria penetrans]|uniref:LPXTG cell wall anchor domain-containing protein n=1 Tax=Pasteuria penetrans TaxID=86005 RepID=UPI0011EEC522|nr:LPXTG cell wall anchor domain-containing protein [Pasteuria penetrans]
MKIIYHVKESTKLKLKQITTALLLTTALAFPTSLDVGIRAQGNDSKDTINSSSGGGPVSAPGSVDSSDKSSGSAPRSDEGSGKSPNSASHSGGSDKSSGSAPGSADSGQSSGSGGFPGDPSNSSSGDLDSNRASSRADVRVQPGSSGQASAQASVGGSQASAVDVSQLRIQQSSGGKFSFSSLPGLKLNEVRLELLDSQGSVVDVCSQVISQNAAQACNSGAADGSYAAKITVSANKSAESSVRVVYSSSSSSVVVKDGKASLVGREVVARKSAGSKVSGASGSSSSQSKESSSSSSSKSSSSKSSGKSSSALPDTGNDYVSSILLGGAVGMVGLTALFFLRGRRMTNVGRIRR